MSFFYFLELSRSLSVFVLHRRSEYCLSKSGSHWGPQGIQPSGPSAGVSARHDSPTLHIPVHQRAEMSPDGTADPPFGRPTTPLFYIRTSPTPQHIHTHTITPSHAVPVRVPTQLTHKNSSISQTINTRLSVHLKLRFPTIAKLFIVISTYYCCCYCYFYYYHSYYY